VEKTLAIIKPDAVACGWDRYILNEIRDQGFVLHNLKRCQYATEFWREFYNEHAERAFFPALVDFMACNEVVAMEMSLPGRVNVIGEWRHLMGATDSRDAARGTLRGHYGDKTGDAIWRNVVHGSASRAEAEREILLFFPLDAKLTAALTIADGAVDLTRDMRDCPFCGGVARGEEHDEDCPVLAYEKASAP
jgi:nucleoside-diphosphate kinase